MRSNSANHQSYYTFDNSYSHMLNTQNSSLFLKYKNELRSIKSGAKILDIGCGTGQVVDMLTQEGLKAYGIEVSKSSLAMARNKKGNYVYYDGKKIPFANQYFDSVGAFNVLEHTDQPEEFIKEMVRVTKKGGKIVISTPNFLRVLGFKDYHPKMRGIKNKAKNFKEIMKKIYLTNFKSHKHRFTMMNPITRKEFQPDDDAIVITNPVDILFFLKKNHCTIKTYECTDRYVPKPIESLLNLSPLKYIMFNCYIVAYKKS